MLAAGAPGRACKLASALGLEEDTERAVNSLAKLVLTEPHAHLRGPQDTTEETTKDQQLGNKGAIMFDREWLLRQGFRHFPPEAAPDRDGWTRELLKDICADYEAADLFVKYVQK